MDNKTSKEQSIKTIRECINALTAQGKKPIQKNVAASTGLSVMTVKRYWKDCKGSPVKDKKGSPDTKKVSPATIEKGSPVAKKVSSFNRLKQRTIIGESPKPSIIETIPSLQKLLNKV